MREPTLAEVEEEIRLTEEALANDGREQGPQPGRGEDGGRRAFAPRTEMRGPLNGGFREGEEASTPDGGGRGRLQSENQERPSPSGRSGPRSSAQANRASQSANKPRPSSAPRTRGEGGGVTGSQERRQQRRQGSGANRRASSAPRERPRGNESRRSADPARIERLAKPKRPPEERGEWDAKREEEERKECTFRPKTRQSPYVAARSRRGKSVEDRLHAEHEEWQEAREDARRSMEEEELNRCTFAPQLDRQSRKLAESTPAAHRPIHERVGDVLRRKHEVIAEAQASSETQSQLTFKPSIGQTSARLADAVRRNGQSHDVADRLYNEGRDKQRIAHKRHCRGDEDAEELRFEPEVCPTSEQIVGSLERMGAMDGNFIERQQEWAARVEYARQLQAEQFREAEGCTFTPDTGNAEAVLARSRHVGILGETNQERYERLSAEDAARREELAASLAEEHYGKYPFQPKVTEPAKRQISGSFPAHKRLSNDNSKEVAREEVKRQLAQAEGQECTFQPKINRHLCPKRSGSPEELIDRIDEFRQRREALAQQRKHAEDLRELSECTFQPAVKRTSPSTFQRGPVVVRGLGRHLELSELRRRQHAEFQEKAQRVFHANPQPPSSGRTIPSPFHLRSEERHPPVSHSQQQDEQPPPHPECTFRPSTERARQRDIVRRILGQHSGDGGFDEGSDDWASQRDEGAV